MEKKTQLIKINEKKKPTQMRPRLKPIAAPEGSETQLVVVGARALRHAGPSPYHQNQEGRGKVGRGPHQPELLASAAC